ncbi:MAG: type II secretion system protein [Longimicrobiales bacterium]
MKNSERPGFTLLELTCALALIGIILGIAAPPFSSARDILAVRAARDAIVAASARARASAIHHGGADMQIDAAAGTVRITSRDRVIDESVALTGMLAVLIQLDGTQATSATLVYDGLGLGRVASRTISLRRRGAVGGVTFSSYGRPRVW